MKVSFIIPVYNRIDITRRCLESLQRTVRLREVETVIVDDGSNEPVASELQALAHGNIQVVRNPRNSGYARANNLGADASQGDILFFLNNDLVLQEGWFEPMVKAFARLPRLGLIGNVQRRLHDRQIDHSGYAIDWAGEFSHRKLPNLNRLGFVPRYTKFHAVTGACCAMLASTFRAVGGFDETFRNGCEDLDLCFRLSQRGLRIYVANRSEVLHEVSSTRGPPDDDQERNFRYLQRRWREEIRRIGAYSWPDHYMRQCFRRPRIAKWTIARQALPVWLGLKKGPVSIAVFLTDCQLARNERHWRSRLDGWSDEQIKKAEQREHGRWMADSVDYEGLFPSPSHGDGVWMRETARITLPRGVVVSDLSIRGVVHKPDVYRPASRGRLGLKITVNRVESRIYFPIQEGPFRISYTKPPIRADSPNEIEVELLGVSLSNALAYFGRIWQNAFWLPKPWKIRLQSYRPQLLNQRLMVHGLDLNHEKVLDFESQPSSPLVFSYVQQYGNLGINLVGWFDAELGIGESVRLAAKALRTTQIAHVLVPLKVNCLANRGDQSLAHELIDENPYPINIFHIDAPQAADIDHHHGDHFRKDRYNIAYWAWELPEFPVSWIKFFRYFDEIWTPSNFVRDAISAISPLPVLAIPHCIQFDIPRGDCRAKFGLPADKFLFMFVYDLNSYQERKNPRAVIEAFRRAFSGTEQWNRVGLILKVQSAKSNPKEFDELKASVADIENSYIIDKTIPRADVYALMQAADCYVSLHRSEGFGLTIAESMYLGKPVIATNWSANTEFMNSRNSCPVDFELIRLEKTYGPYTKGQLWADPSIEHASHYMRKLVEDPSLAASIGDQARRDIGHLLSPQRVGQLIDRRIKAMSFWDRRKSKA